MLDPLRVDFLINTNLVYHHYIYDVELILLAFIEISNFFFAFLLSLTHKIAMNARKSICCTDESIRNNESIEETRKDSMRCVAHT